MWCPIYKQYTEGDAVLNNNGPVPLPLLNRASRLFYLDCMAGCKMKWFKIKSNVKYVERRNGKNSKEHFCTGKNVLVCVGFATIHIQSS